VCFSLGRLDCVRFTPKPFFVKLPMGQTANPDLPEKWPLKQDNQVLIGK